MPKNILTLLLAITLWPEVAHAAVASTPTADIINGIATGAVMVMTLIEFLAFFIFSFLNVLLDPLFVMDVAATEALRNIWKYSRDLMNVIFAFMLIAAGIYTVVTGNKEVVANKWKKFILAVILVNFSWFFPRVIFDVANVLTATIYQIPSGLSGGVVECRHPPAAGETVGKPCKVYTNITYGRERCNEKIAEPDSEYLPGVFGFVCYTVEDWNTETNTAYGMLNGLVMNYGRLPDLPRVLAPEVGAGAIGATGTLAKSFAFILHILFVIILMLMLFLPLAAMLVVFMIRIPIIWVTIAFMPFMFLGFVMGDQMKGFDSMKIFHKFVAAAFLPAAVAVPFAAGFLILSQVTQIDCRATVAAGANFCNKMGPFIHGVDTLWGMLMLLIGFFVIWMGFWAALSIDPIYEKVAGGIKGFGESIGRIGMKLPLSIPILPVGEGGKRTSILGAKAKVNQFGAGLDAGRSPWEAMSGDSGSDKVVDALKDTTTELNKTLSEMATNMSNGGGTLDQLKSKISVELQSETSTLHKELTKLGADPSSMSADDVVRQMETSGDTTIMEAINKLRENAAPSEDTDT